MNSVIAVLVFLLGTIVGSFLNVVILRYDTKKSVSGRSHCPNCKKTLAWYELIPVVSFVIQKGRCRSCAAVLSWQYPIVEVVTGILFLGVHLHFADLFLSTEYVLRTLFSFVIMSSLVVIGVYDTYHKIIPNPFVYTLIALGGLKLIIEFLVPSIAAPSVWDVLAGPILFAPFALLWLVSKGRWMGFGDAKLAWAMGWLLGLRIGLSAVILGFWIGAVYSIALLLLQRFSVTHTPEGAQKLTMKSEVPFGPFLIAGMLIGFFFAFDVLSLNYLVLGV